MPPAVTSVTLPCLRLCPASLDCTDRLSGVSAKHGFIASGSHFKFKESFRILFLYRFSMDLQHREPIYDLRSPLKILFFYRFSMDFQHREPIWNLRSPLQDINSYRFSMDFQLRELIYDLRSRLKNWFYRFSMDIQHREPIRNLKSLLKILILNDFPWICSFGSSFEV